MLKMPRFRYQVIMVVLQSSRVENAAVSIDFYMTPGCFADCQHNSSLLQVEDCSDNCLTYRLVHLIYMVVALSCCQLSM